MLVPTSRPQLAYSTPSRHAAPHPPHPFPPRLRLPDSRPVWPTPLDLPSHAIFAPSHPDNPSPISPLVALPNPSRFDFPSPFPTRRSLPQRLAYPIPDLSNPFPSRQFMPISKPTIWSGHFNPYYYESASWWARVRPIQGRRPGDLPPSDLPPQSFGAFIHGSVEALQVSLQTKG
jgi:hypothetical protein